MSVSDGERPAVRSVPVLGVRIRWRRNSSLRSRKVKAGRGVTV